MNVTFNPTSSIKTIHEQYASISTLTTFQLQSHQSEYTFPWIAVAYIVVMIIAIPGNFLILWITLANKSMRLPIHLLVCNLAVAGLLIALIRIPIRTNQLIYPSHQYPFSMSVCRMAQIIPASCVTSISITLTAICVERYFNIIYPTNLKLRMTANKVYLLIFICWVVSTLFWTPYTTFMHMFNINNHTKACLPNWPTQPKLDIIIRNQTTNAIIHHIPFSKLIVWLLFIIFVFLIPAIVMVTLYAIIVKRLWRTPPGHRTMSMSASRSSMSGRRENNLHSENHGLKLKRRVIKICVACVILFLLTNFPYYFLLVLLDFHLIEFTDRRSVTVIADILILLNYTCIAYNAIIYGYFNKNYRRNAPKWLNLRAK
ncbi:Neuropeptide FF receptor 2 [Trichoplax sp. H2]|nr:Neuropeptide FF receptor 2 [Trichoplax sp. H2]|eukprot:RDD42470.1 Neuropeptide FF receptor 2 [Trichoplax sp. H2]